MATLTITQDEDFRGDTLTNIDSFLFQTADPSANAIFSAAQFGPGLISNTLSVTGDGQVDQIEVRLGAAASFSAAGWSFSNWDPTADGIFIVGSSGADTITGSSQADVIDGGSGADNIDGGAGADTADYRSKTAAVTVTLNGASNATVTVGGVAEDTIKNIENVYGGTGGDTLTGDGFANQMQAGRGNDILQGGLGKDTLNGGFDVDTVDYRDKTAPVIVTLNGGHYTTVKVGGVAEDSIKNIANVYGGSGADTLTGDSLANALYGGDGDDLLKGGDGADFLSGQGGVDTADYRDKTASVAVALNGSSNVTVKVGGIAEDTIAKIENVYGGSGGDTLTGDGFVNALYGGEGDDLLKGGNGLDTLNGQGGMDTVDYRDKTASVVVGLNGSSDVTVTVGGVAEDTIKNIENVYGGSGADTLSGDSLANGLSGGGGDDLLKGGDGADTLNGGVDLDTVDYRDKAASVALTLNGGHYVTVTVGGVSEDKIKNIENVFGGSGGDTLTGDGFVNALYGGEGDDLLKGGNGLDTLNGQGGIDTVDYRDKTASVVVGLNGSSDVTVTVGGVAEDTIKNIENVYGGSGADTLSGDSLANGLSGGAGDDLLKGGAGADTLDGGVGVDGGVDTVDYRDKTADVVVTLHTHVLANVVTVGGVAEDTISHFENVYGGSGDDTLTGDRFVNALYGGDGDDVLKGGIGDEDIPNGGTGDTLDGQGGVDTVDYSDLRAQITVELTNHVAYLYSYPSSLSIDTLYNIENVYGGSGNDSLLGDESDNVLLGGDGDDVLAGNGGADTLDGQAGTDTAAYGDETENVVATLNGATATTVTIGGVAEDTIRNIESLWGGSGDDVLTGDGQDNILWGYEGENTLTGEAGADTFWVFSQKVGGAVDHITDFASEDTVVLFDLYSALPSGTLRHDAFYSAPGATSANDSSDRIVYNTTTGALYYDADGNTSGGVAAVEFAVFDNHVALTNEDFVV